MGNFTYPFRVDVSCLSDLGGIVLFSIVSFFCCKDISRKYIPDINIQSSTGLVPFDLGIFILYGQHIYPLHIVEVLIHVKQSLRLITWFAFCPKWML